MSLWFDPQGHRTSIQKSVVESGKSFSDAVCLDVSGTRWRWWRRRLRCWTRCGSTGSWGASTNRTAGTTPTSSPPSPPWSETATFHSRLCPPARCRCPPSSNQVRDPVREVKMKVGQKQLINKQNLIKEVWFYSLFLSQVGVQRPHRRCSG